MTEDIEWTEVPGLDQLDILRKRTARRKSFTADDGNYDVTILFQYDLVFVSRHMGGLSAAFLEQLSLAGGEAPS